MTAKIITTALLMAVFLRATETPPSHPLFTDDAVHEIRLTFNQADWWETLTANYQRNATEPEYLEASFRWNDVAFDSIGVRFKGLSSNSVQGKKKPFRLKLNEFVKGQKINGTGSLSLSNFWNDPSFVREKVYYELAAAAGLAAPRANFAALYINGEYWGLYSLAEIVNDDFLDTRFPKDNKGSLYKGDPNGTLEDLGDDEETYEAYYEKKTNEDRSWSDLLDVILYLNRMPSAQLAEKLSSLMDIDSVLTALALDNLTVNLDNYIGMGHNYYLYFRPSDGKAQFIPWDPSLAFGALSQGLTVDGMKTLPLEWLRSQPAQIGGAPPGGRGIGGGARPLASRLWEVPEILARYRAIAKRLNEQVVRPAQIVDRMESLRRLISPWVATDQNKLVTLEQFDKAMTDDLTLSTVPGGGGPPGIPNGPNPGAGRGGGMGTVPGISALVRAREESVAAQLAAN